MFPSLLALFPLFSSIFRLRDERRGGRVSELTIFERSKGCRACDIDDPLCEEVVCREVEQTRELDGNVMLKRGLLSGRSVHGGREGGSPE